MIIIKIYPKKGKPYYFQKKIGRNALIGTSNLNRATRFNASIAHEIVRELSVWIECYPMSYTDFDDQLLLAH